MTKTEIRAMLEAKTAEFLANGGEILRGEAAQAACEIAKIHARERAREAREMALSRL